MNRKGFTLVEILIVVAIVLITAGVASDLLISIIRSYNKTRILNEIEQNGNYAIAKISYDLRNARSVVPYPSTNSPTITIGTDAGPTITYSFVDCDSSPTRQVFCVRRVHSTEGTHYITNYDYNNGVNVNTSASNFDIFTDPPSVRVELELRQAASGLATTSSGAATVKFDTTINLVRIN